MSSKGKNNIDNAMTGAETLNRLSSFTVDAFKKLIVKAAIQKPTIIEPVSPINILRRLDTLSLKKAINAPTTLNPTTASLFDLQNNEEHKV